MNDISVVINYCSLEREFLNGCITESLKFSEDVVVSYGSHFYDGTIEDHEHIQTQIIKFPMIQFVEYRVDVSLDLSKQKGVVNRPFAYWHNLARWTGLNGCKKKNWILFLDVDEIPDGKRFNSFLSHDDLDEDFNYSIANYWYFKSPNFQAIEIEESAKLINYKYINSDSIFGDFERDHIRDNSARNTHHFVSGHDGLPLIHHFSWVRTQDILLRKIKSWGHADDIKNPDEYVDRIFMNKNINDIAHRYSYKYVHNQFNIGVNTFDYSYPMDESFDKEVDLIINRTEYVNNSAQFSSLDVEGLSILRKGDASLAILHFWKSIEDENRNNEYYYHLGIAMYLLNDFESALEIFTMALSINQSNDAVKFGLGRCLFKIGKNKESLDCFLEVIKGQELIVQANYYAGCAYFNEQDYSNALSHFTVAQDLGYKSKGLEINHALCLEKLNHESS
jgi:tetratricopeptide (TPR) repeat protein